MKNKIHKIKFVLNSVFIKRFLARFVSLTGIALFTAAFISIFAIANVHAAGTCVDLTGQSTLVGVGDAGEFDFNAEPPDPSYGAKLCEPNVPGDDFELHGWVWNTNLGWVSLACEDGYNENATCGNYDYGVKIDGDTEEMYGWAWGDNIGWISFGCSGGSNEGYACGSVPYSGTGNLTVDQDLGTMTGYAWADTVGWFNLDGIGAKILALVMTDSSAETDYGVWTKVASADDKTGSQINKNNAPVATGKSGITLSTNAYDIYVHISSSNGDPILETTPNLTIEITPQWTGNIMLDQTDPGAIDDATVKPLNIGDFNYGIGNSAGGTNIENNWRGEVFSYAPTDNFFDKNENGIYDSAPDSGEIYYKEFASETMSENTLRYHGTKVKLTIDDGDPATIDETWEETLPPLYNPGGYDLIFLPPFEFKDFYSIVDNTADPVDAASNLKDEIKSFRNMIDYYLIKPTANISGFSGKDFNIKLNLGVDETLSPGVNYIWIDDITDTLPDDPNDPDLVIASDKIITISGAVSKFESMFPIKFSEILSPVNEDYIAMALPYAPGQGLGNAIPGATANIIVSYTLVGKTVRYFDNGIPRVSDTGIVNQAAEITGNVYSSGTTQASTDVEAVNSLGNISSSALQNIILENASKLIAGADVDENPGKIKFNSSMPESYFASFGGGRGYYFKNKDVYIKETDWIQEEDRPATIIVEGGDVFIDTNINNDDGPIGIIVLEDYSDPDQATKGGRVYIHSNVTDFVGHIYADGPMFRYTNGICFQTTNYQGLEAPREPNFVSADRCADPTDYFNPVTTLKNQLYMKGSFSTYNCIGCAISDPYRGDGQLLEGRTPINYSIARLYDLNYFSYFDHTDTSAGTSEILDAMGGKLGPIYIDYSPIPGNMLGFI